MAISAKMVKELRETTGAGMLDCKKALEATDGNIESAIDWLREKGISKAAKKQTRIAAEGLAYSKIDGNKAVIVELNSETDFVAKNEEFKSLVEEIANIIITNDVKNVEEALALKISDKDVAELIAEKSGTIGEKLTLRRFEVLTKNNDQIFGTYSHMGGKIVTLVVLDGSDEELAKDIAMQAAAMKPLYLTRDEVPEERVEKERAILMEQAENEGLDENKLPMIINGRLNKFFEEVCLVDQSFIKESKVKVAKYVKEKNSNIIKFVRYEVGEGIEKKQENFADEVMKQVNG